jgi:hypothetical protein
MVYLEDYFNKKGFIRISGGTARQTEKFSKRKNGLNKTIL